MRGAASFAIGRALSPVVSIEEPTEPARGLFFEERTAMAMNRVRHASISIESKKVGECHRIKSSYSSNDELQLGDDGYIGISDGAGQTQIEFEMFVPYSGATVNPKQLMLLKQDVDVEMYLVNGQIESLSMRFIKADTDSDAKAGTLMGSFTLIGGEPTLT